MFKISISSIVSKDQIEALGVPGNAYLVMDYEGRVFISTQEKRFSGINEWVVGDLFRITTGEVAGTIRRVYCNDTGSVNHYGSSTRLDGKTFEAAKALVDAANGRFIPDGVICNNCRVYEGSCDQLNCSHGNPERCTFFQAAKEAVQDGDLYKANQQLLPFDVNPKRLCRDITGRLCPREGAFHYNKNGRKVSSCLCDDEDKKECPFNK